MTAIGSGSPSIPKTIAPVDRATKPTIKTNRDSPNDMSTDVSLTTRAREARRLALLAIHAAGSGHPGGALSCLDLLTALYKRMRFDPADPQLPERDRLILSKGHSAPALYAAAAVAGLCSPDDLQGLRKLGHPLQGHPHVRTTPWVEASTGSLGHGFSAALGMAMGLRHQGIDARVYAILGDGEMQEGETWEALMAAAHFGLGRLCAILDYNKFQSDDTIARVMAIEPLADKIRSFGWRLEEIDGHDFGQIDAALNRAEQINDTPTFIIAHTLKGKGVEFMEGRPDWHGSLKMSDADLELSLRQLGATADEIQRYLHGHWSN